MTRFITKTQRSQSKGIVLSFPNSCLGTPFRETLFRFRQAQSVTTSMSPATPALLRALEYRQWTGSST